MADEIRTNYLLYDDPYESSFGIQDVRGDLDAYYLLRAYRSSDKALSTIMEEYFTESLTDKDRALYFITNRLPNNLTNKEIRQAMLSVYRNNSGVTALEAERDLLSDALLREASVYAFADYLYELCKEELANMDYTDEDNPDIPVEKVFTRIKEDSTTLAHGVENKINYILTPEDYQTVYYTTIVDLSRDDVSIHANYHNNHPTTWQFSRMTDQIAAAIETHTDPNNPKYVENYQVVAGVNGDYYNMANGKPAGPLVMEGVVYKPNERSNFFGVLKDGTAIIRRYADYVEHQDEIVEAIGGGGILVENGVSKVKPIKPELRETSRASRTAVGLTADNKVILMTFDGRQKPYSTGANMEEISQAMLDAGAVIAMNLDGGGSASMVAKREGEDKLSIISRPSDGYERSIASSLFVVSTAVTSNEFSHALITSTEDYLTTGSSLELSKVGVSSSVTQQKYQRRLLGNYPTIQ